MKNAVLRSVSILVLVCLLASCFAGCQSGDTPSSSTKAPITVKDYAGEVKLDMNSSTKKAEVTVKTFVDGDTTHFHISDPAFPLGFVKARYLGINTPESTGKIEEWGKKASKFTREKLENATSIIIESDDENWNTDTTGDRYLLWIWYKTADSEEYRNLNIELLQNGLSVANKSSQNRYGTHCTGALAQAEAQKLNVFSGQKDPDFYYGPAQEITLKALRTNIEAYNNTTVAFTGVITMTDGTGYYVESYDEDSGMYFGIYIFPGFNLQGTGLEIMSLGNEVRIVGSVQFYETAGSWQVTDLSYDPMEAMNPNNTNIELISKGHSPSYVLTAADKFANAKVDVELADETKTFDYAELIMGTSIEMKNLYVKKVYTTNTEGSSSKGAMTLTCEVDGITISVRTEVMYDEDGKLITEEAYLGKTIDVKGIVDEYNGTYQIGVMLPEQITVHN